MSAYGHIHLENKTGKSDVSQDILKSRGMFVGLSNGYIRFTFVMNMSVKDESFFLL